MTSLGDLEWQQWARTWGTVGEDAPARWVRRMVERQSRLMRWVVGVEVVVTVVVLVATAWTVRNLPPLSAGTILGVAILHSAVIWGFTLRNRAGIWSPLGATMRDYLVLARERCRRERRAARFTLWLLAVEGILLTVWVLVRDTAVRRPPPFALWWVPSAVVVVGAVIWPVWVDRRAHGRLERLDRAADQLGVDRDQAVATDGNA